MVVNDATRNVLYTTTYRKAGATPEKETKLDKNLSDKITGNSGSFFATQKGIKYLVAYRKSDLSGWDTISMVPVKKILTGFEKNCARRCQSSKKIFFITMTRHQIVHRFT